MKKTLIIIAGVSVLASIIIVIDHNYFSGTLFPILIIGTIIFLYQKNKQIRNLVIFGLIYAILGLIVLIMTFNPPF